MFKKSFRALVVLLALAIGASMARADSVMATGSCLFCLGTITGGHVSAYPVFYSTSSDLSSLPGLGAEFGVDLPWALTLDAGRFTAGSTDGKLTVSGTITSFDLTFTPVFHQPLVYFSTVTDSVQWIDATGHEINIPQSGGGGSGVFGSTGGYLQGSFSFIFDLPNPVSQPVPEPGTLLLLSAGLLAFAPWVRRRK